MTGRQDRRKPRHNRAALPEIYGIAQEQFVSKRTQRDATLEMPRLILPSIQVNIRAGELPPAEDNGTHYLKIPINAL